MTDADGIQALSRKVQALEEALKEDLAESLRIKAERLELKRELQKVSQAIAELEAKHDRH